MLIDYKDTGLPTYDIDLQEAPEDRWKCMVEAERSNLESLFQEVLDLVEVDPKLLPRIFRPLVATGRGLLAGKAIPRIAALFGQEYVKEINGVARTADLPVGHVFLANLMYDLVLAAERTEWLVEKGRGYVRRWRGACSSYSSLIRGHPVLVRNMDWNLPESIGKHTRVVRFHRGNQFYTTVSVLGSVGVLSAMMKGKWAVTLNQAPIGSQKLNVFQWPVMHRIRNVCDQMQSYAETVDELQAYQTMTPFYAHVVGVSASEQTVVMGRGKYFYERPVEEDILIQTNHSIGCAEEDNPTREGFKDPSGATYFYDTYPRFEALESRLKKRPTTLDAALKKLAQQPVTHDATQQQMLLRPATGTMRLKIRC